VPTKRHLLDRRARQIASACEGPPDQLIDTHALAEWLGVSVQWCETVRTRGEGPPFHRINARRIRYKRADVVSWLAQRRELARAKPFRRRLGDAPEEPELTTRTRRRLPQREAGNG
jgi:hypothetical protein